MRRYLPLLLIAFFLIVASLAGVTFLDGQAVDPPPETKSFVILYTTIPVEQASVLAEAYERETRVTVRVTPLTPAELSARLAQEAGEPVCDLVVADRRSLEELAGQKLLTPFVTEQSEIVPKRFCGKDDLWTGVWYDPIIFVANQDFLKKQINIPSKWADLTKPANVRLVMADPLAAEASANVLYTLAAVNGEAETLAYMAKLHPRMAQYAKFLNTPPRMTGLGEADIGIAVMSESLRYAKDGFPVRLIFPQEGTPYLLTGAALVKGSRHSEEARRLLAWLLQNQAQTALQDNRFYLVPTNPDTDAYREYNAKNLRLFPSDITLDRAQQGRLLDKWVESVRTNPR